MKVYDYFKESGPGSWCKGHMAILGKDGKVQHCVLGALVFFYDDAHIFTGIDAMLAQLRQAYTGDRGASIQVWNDAPETTFEEVLKMTKRAGI